MPKFKTPTESLEALGLPAPGGLRILRNLVLGGACLAVAAGGYATWRMARAVAIARDQARLFVQAEACLLPENGRVVQVLLDREFRTWSPLHPIRTRHQAQAMVALLTEAAHSSITQAPRFAADQVAAREQVLATAAPGARDYARMQLEAAQEAQRQVNLALPPLRAFAAQADQALRTL